jgi:hypothetical protein
MANIRAAQIGNARPRTPMLHNLFLVQNEVGIIVWDLAAPTKLDPCNGSDGGIGRDMEQAAVDPVHIFADLFDFEDMIAEVRLQTGAEQLAQHGQIERCFL